jgi:hypothetical protein
MPLVKVPYFPSFLFSLRPLRSLREEGLPLSLEKNGKYWFNEYVSGGWEISRLDGKSPFDV